MSAAGPLADRKAHLSSKLAAIARLAAHLNYSRRRLPYPLKSLAALDDAGLESVSALLERFGRDNLPKNDRHPNLLSQPIETLRFSTR